MTQNQELSEGIFQMCLLNHFNSRACVCVCACVRVSVCVCAREQTGAALLNELNTNTKPRGSNA